jgi:TIGR03009 family protein
MLSRSKWLFLALVIHLAVDSPGRSQPPRESTAGPPRSTSSPPAAPVPDRLPEVRQGARDSGGSSPNWFPLSAQQQADLDQVLLAWERHGAKINTFRCAFERLEYDPVFLSLQEGETTPVTRSLGEVKYAKPDKGLFRIRELYQYNVKTRDYEKTKEPDEHWVCDGKAIYEFSSAKKQLIVRELPAEMRGQAIADGPLPFLFNAEAEKLNRRYFIRITNSTPESIWLEAAPRFQQDAASFQRVELILDRQRFLPSAMQLYLPNGKSRTVYVFQIGQAKVNDPLERFIGVFEQPRPPIGWTKVVEPAPPSHPPRQAARLGPSPAK